MAFFQVEKLISTGAKVYQNNNKASYFLNISERNNVNFVIIK